MFKKVNILVATSLVALVFGVFACKQQSKPVETKSVPEKTAEPQPPKTETAPKPEEKPMQTGQEKVVAGVTIQDKEKAVIETNLGTIELAFFSDKAPKHVENFKKLAKDGFYNGTRFHRVIPGFMIQGGDPNTKQEDRSKHGIGGPGYNVNAEFNERPHLRGTLSMARAADPNSAGSQFFICVKDTPFLDGKYTVFGHVLSGLDVVDKIVAVPRDSNDNPNDAIIMKSVTIAAL